VRSVANLTRADGEEFFRQVSQGEVKSNTTIYPLEEANEALHALRSGRIEGAAVLVPGFVACGGAGGRDVKPATSGAACPAPPEP